MSVPPEHEGTAVGFEPGSCTPKFFYKHMIRFTTAANWCCCSTCTCNTGIRSSTTAVFGIISNTRYCCMYEADEPDDTAVTVRTCKT